MNEREREKEAEQAQKHHQERRARRCFSPQALTYGAASRCPELPPTLRKNPRAGCRASRRARSRATRGPRTRIRTSPRASAPGRCAARPPRRACACAARLSPPLRQSQYRSASDARPPFFRHRRRHRAGHRGAGAAAAGRERPVRDVSKDALGDVSRAHRGGEGQGGVRGGRGGGGSAAAGSSAAAARRAGEEGCAVCPLWWAADDGDGRRTAFARVLEERHTATSHDRSSTPAWRAAAAGAFSWCCC